MKTPALVALGLWLLFCVAGATHADSTETRRCAGYCKGSNKFKYQPGHTYVYDYRIDTSSGISGTAKEESRLHLAATAEISVISQCDFRLQLRDLVLEDSLPSDAAHHRLVPGMAEIADALERHPLLFSFQDGKVEELCPSGDDAPWVMNIKRGVLSTFQNSIASLELEETVVYEKDVTGLCETTYTTSSPKLPAVVMKSKDLLSCTHRLDHYLSLQSTPYSSPVNVHSLPLVKSQHSCKQNIGATGLLERAICNEVHLFRPFSNGENGAKTKVSQYLILKETVSDIQPTALGPAGYRTTLLYHHTQDDYTLPSEEQTVTFILEELEKKTKNGVEGEVPQLFAQLVADLRTLSYPQLSALFSNPQQTTSRQFLLDALSLVGTADAVTLMIDLHRSKEITDTELDSWLTSMSFQKKPSLGMLAAVSTLLDRSPRQKAILSVSAMVHSYCKLNTDCDSETVKDIIIKIEQILGNNCNPKDENHMQLIIVALKGIGNAGVVVNSLNTLKKCYEKDNPIEVRLAAIDAYRRLSCDVAPRSHLLDTYINMHGDTEIRIAAYLAAMQCPTPQTFHYVKDILYKEEVNQVASFVWTHLTNMQETSSRWKQGIKALISNDFLKNKFSTDVRKFSRNYEASTYFDSMNAGAAIESNVIFTPQSYLPRSASLNLTLDLFGESFNVFEIGARAEGFEQTIESMFGPGGYFPDETVKKFLKNYRDKGGNELDSSIDKLSGAFDAQGKMRQEPEASLYARMFGNELLYSRFKGFKKFLGEIDNNYKDQILRLALDEGTEYMKSFSLIDASYTIPTAAGLPLEFAVNGSAILGLKYSGLMHVKEVTKGAISLSGELAPSAAVEITGTMSVRAFTAKAGITSVNKLNTNTYFGGAVKIVHGKIVDIKINVPKEKMEILDVSTKLFILQRDVQQEIEGIQEDREEQKGCSSDIAADMFGMKFCGELAYPNASRSLDAPYFPLTGPFSLQISLLKTDNFSRYDFGYKYNPDPDISSLNLNFDTVGSQTDRKIQFLGVYDRKKSSVNVNLRTPFLKIATNAMLTLNSDVKRIDGAISFDNTNFFEINAGVETGMKNNIGNYEPFLKLIYKDRSLLDISGKVHYIQGVKYSADLKLKSHYKPVFIKGDLKLQNQGYFVRASMNSSFINGNLEGAVRKVSDYISSHAKLQYSIQQAKEQSIEISNKMLLSTKGDAEFKSIQSSAKFSEFPDYNLDVSWELRRGYRLFSHALTWTFGGTTWETSQIFRLQYLKEHIDFQLLGLLGCKQKGIDYKLDIKHQTTDFSLISHAIAHLGADHKYIASYEYLDNEQGSQSLSMELSYSKFNATINGRLMEVSSNNYEFSLDGFLNMKRKQRLSGMYSDGSNELQQGHSFQIQLTGDLNGELVGALKASEKSTQQWLQLSFSGQKYREEITYTYDGLHNFDIVVQLANRSYRGIASISNTNKEKGVTITLDFSTKLTFVAKVTSRNRDDFDTIEAELTWNRVKYPNNRIYLIGESLDSKSHFNLEFPGQQITGELINLPGSIETKLQWYPNRVITAVLQWNLALRESQLLAKLETPWRGLEKQYLSAQHEVSSHKAQCKVDVSWQKQNLLFLATGEKKIKYNGAWSAVAHVRLSSSLAHLANITLNADHTYDKQIESNAKLIYGNQETSLSFKHQTSISNTITYFSLAAPWLEHPIKSKLTFKADDEAYSGSTELIWAPDKEISGNFVWLRKKHFSTILQLVTPFKGYEKINTELLFKRQLSDFDILGKVAFSDNLYLLTFQRSISDEYITYGKCVTPFTHPFEVNIQHSAKYYNIEKDIVEIKYNNKEVIKFSKEYTYSAWSREGNKQLLFALNFKTHVIYLKFNNVIGDKKELFMLDGKWNAKSISIHIEGNSTRKNNNYMLHYHGKIFGSIFQTPIEMDFLHTQNNNKLNTGIQIPGGIHIQHSLTFDNLFSWKNVLNIQTPWQMGTITNIQSYQEQETKFHHSMLAEVGGKQVEALISITMDSIFEEVRELKGTVNSSWSDPVTVHYFAMDDDNFKKAQLTINFKQKKIIIRNVHKFQLLEKFFLLQVESPYHEPLSLTAGYNGMSPIRDFSLKLEWARNTFVINSHFKFDVLDGFGKLIMKGTHSDQDMLGIAMNYNFKHKKKFIDFYGLSGENEINGTLSYTLDSSYDLKLTIKSLLSGWENIQVMSNIDIDGSDKSACIQIIRNADIFIISKSIATDITLSKINITVKDSLFNIPSISFFGTYDSKVFNNHILNVTCNYDGIITELSLKMDHSMMGIDYGASLEIELRTPLKYLEFLMAHLSYKNDGENNQGITIMLVRNEWKLQVNGGSDFGDSVSSANLNVILPFQDINRLSASFRHNYISNHEQNVNVLIHFNDQNVEIDGSYISFRNELSAKVEIKTPLNGYESMKGNFTLIGVDDQQKSISLNLVTKKHSLKMSGTLNIHSLFHVVGNVRAEFPLSKKIVSAGLSYDLTGAKEAKRYTQCYLTFPDDKYNITALIDSSKRNKMTFELSIDMPTLVSEMSGSYELHQRSLTANFNVVTDKKNSVLTADLLVQETLLNFTFISPAIGYDKLSLLGRVNWETQEKIILLNFIKNDQEYKASLATSLDYHATEIKLDIYTPIKNWNELNVHGKYDFISDTTEEIKLIAVKGEQSFDLEGKWYTMEDGIHSSLNILQTSLGIFRLTANVTEENCTVRFMSEDNDGRKFLDGFLNISESHIHLTLESKFSQLQHMNIATTFDTNNLLTLKLKYRGIGSENDTFKSEVEITSDKLFIKMDPFLFNTNTQNFNSTLTYKNVFNSNPSLSFDVYLDENHILGTTVNATIDWEKNIELNCELQSDALPNSHFNISAWVNPLQPLLNFYLSVGHHQETYLVISSEKKFDSVPYNSNNYIYTAYLNAINFSVSLHQQYHSQNESMITTFIFTDMYDKQLFVKVTLGQELHSIDLFYPTKDNNFTIICEYGSDSMTATLKTPFSGYEQISASGSWELTEQNKKSVSFIISRNGNQIGPAIHYLREPNYSRLSFDLVTTFTSVEKFHFTSEYDFRRQKKTGFLLLRINEKGFKLTGEAAIDNLSAHGMLQIITPITKFRYAKLTVSYDHLEANSNSFNVQGEVNDIKHIDLNLELHCNRNNGKFLLSSLLPLNVSFLIEANYDFSDIIKGHVMEGRMELLGIKSNVSIYLNGKNGHYNQGKFEASVSKTDVSLPTDMSFTILNGKHEKKIQLISSIQGKRTDIKAILVADLSNKIELTLSSDLPTYGLNSFSMKWNKKMKQDISGKLEIYWKSTKIMDIQTTLEKHSAELPQKFTLVLRSSFRNLEDFTFTSTLAYSNGLVSESTMRWGKGKSIILIGSFNFKPHKADNKISLTSSFTEPLIISLDYNLISSEQTLDAKLAYGSKKLQMKVKYIPVERQISFITTTPFEGFTHLHLDGKYMLGSSHNFIELTYQQEDYMTHLAAQMIQGEDNHLEAKIFLSTPMNMLKKLLFNGTVSKFSELSSSLECYWGDRGFMIGKSTFSPQKIRLLLNSTLENWELIDLNSGFIQRSEVDAAHFILVYGKDIINTTATITPHIHGRSNVHINIRTPWTENITLQGVHELKDGHLLHLTFQHGMSSSEIQAKLNYEITNNLSDYKFEAVINNLGKIMIHTGYSKTPSQSKLFLKQEIGTLRIFAVLENSRTEHDVVSKFHLETPFKNMRNVIAIAELNFGTRYGLLMFNKNGEIYRAHAAVNLTHNYFDAQLNIESPMFTMYNATLQASFSIKSVNVSIEAFGKKISTESIFSIQDDLIVLYGLLEVPFIKSWERTSLALNVNIKNLTGSIHGHWNRNDVSAIVNLNPEALHFIIETPFKMLKVAQLSAKLVFAEPHHKLIGFIEWEHFRMDTKVVMKSEKDNYAIKCSLKWNDNHNITIEGRMIFPDSKMKFEFCLLTPFRGLENLTIVSGYETKDNATSFVNFIFSTPPYLLPNLQSTLMYNHNENDSLTMQFMSKWSNQQFAFTFVMSQDDPKYLSGNFNVFMPYRDNPVLQLKGQINKLQNAVDTQLQILDTSYNFSGSYIALENNLTMTLGFQTPRIKSQIYIKRLAHDNMYKGELSFSVNENDIMSFYDIQQSSMTANLRMNAPSLSIPESFTNIHLDHSESGMAGSVSYKYYKQGGEVVLNVNRKLKFSRENQQNEMKEYYLSNIVFKGNHSYESISWSGSVTLENNDEDLSIFVQVTAPNLYSKEVSLFVNKNYKLLELKVADKLNFKLSLQEGSGFLMFSYSMKIHKFQYSLKSYDGFQGSYQFESPLISKNINLTYKNMNSQLETKFSSDFESLYKSISLEYEIKGKTKIMRVEVISQESQLLRLESEFYSEKDKFRTKIVLDTLGVQQSMEVTHKSTFPLHSQLLINIPYLVNKPVIVLLSTEGQFKAYAGYDHNSSNKYFLLEAHTLQKDGTVNFTLHTPFLSSLKVFSFSGQYLSTFDLQKISASVSYQYDFDMPPVEVYLKFHLSSSLFDSHFKLQTPLKYHDYYEGKLHFPFSFNEDPYLNITLKLPQVKYQYTAAFTTYGESAQFRGIIQHGNIFANATFKLEYIPKFKVFAEINTPFSGFRHYCIDLKGQRNLKDGNSIINYIEWNDKRIELIYSFVVGVKNFIVQVELNTPFHNFNKYSMKLQYENYSRKVLLASLTYPGLETPVGIEFDYLYNGIFDVNLIAQFKIPFLPGLQAASFLLGNKLNIYEGSYQAVISGNINERKLSLAVEGIVNDNQEKLEVQAHQNDQEVYLKIVNALDGDHKDLFLLEMRTPFPIVKDIKFLSLYGAHQLVVNAFYDSREIVGLNLNSLNSNFNFELRNPIRSFSLSYTNQFYESGLFSANICWDLNNRLESQLGFEYISKIAQHQRWEFQSKLKLPTRTISYDLVNENSYSKLEYAMHFSWEDGKIIGYHVLVKERFANSTVFGRIDFPYRSFEGCLQSIRNPINDFVIQNKAELLWDAADDRNKMVGLDMFIYRNDTIMLKAKCTFFTHDISVQLEKQFRRRSMFTSEEKKIKIIYSSDPDDIFMLGTTYKYEESDKFSAGIFVTHKPSKLHHDIKLEFSNQAEITRGKLNITYLNFNSKEIVNLISSGRIDYQQPEIEIQFRTNENSLVFRGLRWSKKGGYDGISVGCQMNQKEPLMFSAAVNTDKTAVELALSYGNKRHHSLRGQFPNWQEISAEATHTLNDVTIHDGHISVRLNTSQLLWTRVQWSPRIIEDIKLAILEEYEDIMYVINSIGQSYLQLLNEEFHINFPVISFDNITDHAKVELNNIYQDFQTLVSDFSKMYRRNDFFVKDISNALRLSCSQLFTLLQALENIAVELFKSLLSTTKETFSFLWRTLSVDYFIECMKTFIKDIQRVMTIAADNIKALVKCIYKVEELLRNAGKQILSGVRSGFLILRQNLAQISENIESIMMKCIHLLGRSVEKFIENLERQASYIQVEAMVIVLEAADVIENITATLVEIPEVQYLLETYAAYASWLEEFHLQEYLDNIVDILAETVDSLITDVTNGLNKIKMMIIGSSQPYLDEMDQIPMLLCIKNAINNMYQKVVWFWKYYQISNQILEGLNKILEQSDAFLFDALASIDSNFERDSKTNLIFRPDVGLVEYTQELPVEWNGFNEFPKFEQFSWYKMEKRSEEQMATLDKYSYYLVDPLNIAVNKSISALLPPFSKQAVVAGKKHFITFDNKFYDFEGECSYLLASDFLDNKFSAVVNYEIQNHKVVKKSLTIVTEGYHIDIGSNHRVTVDGKKTELPVKVGESTWVIRVGERILLQTNFGMALECNLHHDFCSMELTGWYFGKTGGLLGTFDNEPSNDISLPDGTITPNIEYFARNWQVGKSSRCRSRAQQRNKEDERYEPSKQEAQICKNYFQIPSSPLSPCYPHVDPQSYYSMCLQDIIENKNNGCLSAATYVSQCKKLGIDLWIPPECVNCPLIDGTSLKAGESKVFTNGSPQSADIVLVVEQASCLKSVRLTDTVTKLDNALNMKGMSDVQYSVVGFGGTYYSQPHTRTADGEVWTTRKAVEKALNSLQFDSESADDVNAFDALWYAARLPFRGGVSKTIVLVQCKPCDGQTEMNDYNDILTLLQENDIAFHILQLDAINLDGSPEKSAKIFGMDMEGTYSARNLANLTPRKSLLRQVTIPKDLCVPLALDTNGTVFNLNHMIGERSPSTSKKFLDVWSRRIARDTSPPACQKCQCVANQDSAGQIICSKCENPILEDVLQDLATIWSEEYDDLDIFYQEGS